MPAQHNLGRGTLELAGNGDDSRFLQQCASLADRRPGLGKDALLFIGCALLSLIEMGMKLDLIDAWRHARLFDQDVEIVRQKVRNAN